MSQKVSKTITYLSIITIVIGSIFLANGLIKAGPACEPPDCNVPAPLNVGSTEQSKSGGLILNTGGADDGLIIDKGNVGIGTTDPGFKLHAVTDMAGWGFKFNNTAGTNNYMYLNHGTYGVHIRNDSAPAGNYLLDVYPSNGKRFQVLGDGKVNVGSGTIKSGGSAKTYGGIDIWGKKNSYSGINFFDGSGTYESTFMVDANGATGMYIEGTGWQWYFNSAGALTSGSVPWARLTSVPAGLSDGDNNTWRPCSGCNSSQRIINNTSPTIYFQDTNHRSAMVHVNSNLFYVLRGCGVNSASWCATGGRWPLVINLENNNAEFGGNVWAVSYSGPGCDIAELYEPSQDSEELEPGDIVVLDEEEEKKIKKSSHSYSALVVGVVSTNPNMTMGVLEDNSNEDHPPVALLGRVPTKVTAENGPIKIGDLIVSSSKPGYGMRCDNYDKCQGAVVGKATENLESGEGMIEVLIKGGF